MIFFFVTLKPDDIVRLGRTKACTSHDSFLSLSFPYKKDACVFHERQKQHHTHQANNIMLFGWFLTLQVIVCELTTPNDPACQKLVPQVRDVMANIVADVHDVANKVGLEVNDDYVDNVKAYIRARRRERRREERRRRRKMKATAENEERLG